MADPATDLRSLGDDARYDVNRLRPVTSGASADRPAVTLIRANSFYYETDTKLLYFTDGSTWSAVTVNSIVDLSIVNADVSASAAIEWSKIAPPTFGTSLPGSPANGDYYTLTDSATSPTYVWHLRYFSTPGKWYPMPGSWGFGTTMPTVPSGVDRVRFVLADSTSAPTYAWEFMYNAAESTYKWEYVGGSPKSVQVLTSETPGSTGSYVDLSTTGPSFTVPRSGEYDIWFGAVCAVTTSPSSVAVKLGSAAASGNDDFTVVVSSAGEQHAGSRWIRRTLAASDVLKMQYYAGSTSNSFAKRNLMVVPFHVS